MVTGTGVAEQQHNSALRAMARKPVPICVTSCPCIHDATTPALHCRKSPRASHHHPPDSLQATPADSAAAAAGNRARTATAPCRTARTATYRPSCYSWPYRTAMTTWPTRYDVNHSYDAAGTLLIGAGAQHAHQHLVQGTKQCTRTALPHPCPRVHRWPMSPHGAPRGSDLCPPIPHSCTRGHGRRCTNTCRSQHPRTTGRRRGPRSGARGRGRARRPVATRRARAALERPRRRPQRPRPLVRLGIWRARHLAYVSWGLRRSPFPIPLSPVPRAPEPYKYFVCPVGRLLSHCLLPLETVRPPSPPTPLAAVFALLLLPATASNRPFHQLLYPAVPLAATLALLPLPLRRRDWGRVMDCVLAVAEVDVSYRDCCC